MTGVILQNIVKRFGTTVAVDGVDASVESGSLFFLLGPSGCGKTTLLRIIAGFEQPDDGAIRFGTDDVTQLAAEKRDTGMVFQGYALWPHLSVHENVAFGLKVRKMNAEDITRRVGEALEMVRMQGYAERKPNQLSGGQQQRVALARALAIRPRVLLLDEPLSNLDAKLRLEMRAEIRRIVDESGITTIYVTHDQKEALSLADQMVVMRDGKVVQRGGPREMYERPNSRFTAEFLGETNFLAGEIISTQSGLRKLKTPAGPLLSAHATDAPEQGKVTISIRPESVHLLPEGQAAPEGWSVLEAKRTGMCFLGETAQHDFELPGGEPFKALELRPRGDAANDATVRVAIAPEDVVLLHE
ncbi:MAG: ABC transporter ATP-binding protein [Phycisphaerales bacterium]|nr:ABC transporter ATP-binding protein [Phycisphaerales bacterium]